MVNSSEGRLAMRPVHSGRRSAVVGLRLTLGVGICALLMASCTFGGSDATKTPESVPKTTLPKECAGITDPAKTVSLPPDCANAVLVMRVKESGSAELKKLTPAKLMTLASASCNFGKEIRAAGGNAATPFNDIVASNAESWGISEKAVVQVIEAAGVICPDDIKQVLDLRDGGNPTAIDYVAVGPGEMVVSYTGVDGNAVTEKVQTPWEYRVGMQAVNSVSISVEMAPGGKGQPSCKIIVNRKELASEKAGKSGKVVCEADAGDVKAAAG